MTKKQIQTIITISLIAAAAACAPPPNKQAQLEKLERQREALTEKIEGLKAEMEGRAPAPAPVEKAHVRVARIEPGLFQHFIRIQGTIESDNNILVPARSSGLVKKIHVKAGDRVARNRLLADLDAAVLESGIAELENGLELASTIFERQDRLWKKNIGSEIEYLQAKNNKEGLERKLETLREQVSMTKITSPISGTVDEVHLKEGEMAAAGMGAVRIVQLARLKVTAALSENYISRIKRGDMVQVEIPVLGRSFEHTIAAVSQVIDPKNRTFLIEVRIPPSEKGLKPNLLTVVTVNDYSSPESHSVPLNLVQETGIEKFLFVAAEQSGEWTVRRRAVVTGESYGGQVEILEGLESGEYVVTFGYQNLADGDKITAEIED